MHDQVGVVLVQVALLLQVTAVCCAEETVGAHLYGLGDHTGQLMQVEIHGIAAGAGTDGVGTAVAAGAADNTEGMLLPQVVGSCGTAALLPTSYSAHSSSRGSS